MAQDKAIVNGRGEMQPLDGKRQAELLRALVDRSAKGPPSARRRAIALAGIRIARSAESQRGKA